MNRLSRRNKLLHAMRVKHKDSIPPILISGHQFTMISQHQTAAREYLQAYKLMPDNPLINLCGGMHIRLLGLKISIKNDICLCLVEKMWNSFIFLTFFVGTALINLALGLRLQNKHHTFLQGLAFLYNNLRLCGDSQVCFLLSLSRSTIFRVIVVLVLVLYEAFWSNIWRIERSNG